MEPVVLTLGGSILAPSEGLDVDLAREVADLLRRVAAERTVFVVVGGGATARRYIGAARELGADEATLDDAGIAATRLNARFLLAALPEAHPVPATSHTEALSAARSSPLVVMGGTHAGHTTDAVGAMLAEKARAGRLVVATNVDGVYTADPRSDPDAERLPRLTHEDLVRITGGAATSAGSSGVVDPMAARVLARSRIPAAVVDGKDLKALEAALQGEASFDGSFVTTGDA